MDLNKINSLIEMLDGTDITELNIEDEEFNIKIKKGVQEKTIVRENLNSNNSIDTNEQVTAEIKENSDVDQEKDKEQEDIEKIEAPMVGTFYRSPAPDAEPFVQVGDKVQKGDTLCIIEAMKLMNEIEAEKNGKIKEILVDDSDSVEYGQTLFVMEQE